MVWRGGEMRGELGMSGERRGDQERDEGCEKMWR